MSQNTKRKKQKVKSDALGTLLHGVLVTLFLAVITVLMIIFVRQLYQFGYNIFGEKPGTGVEIEIQFEVAEGESARTTAKRLKDKNLISSEIIFILQKTLFEKDIIAGVHILDSNMTTLEVLDALSTSPGRINDH